MNILKLQGLDGRLFDLVAPLVMNPAVLRQNNNYPFKTTRNHVWYIAMDEQRVLGFMPVKMTLTNNCIDNYYISGDNSSVIEVLLDRIIHDFSSDGSLVAVVHERHVEDFSMKNFIPCVEWKKYVKMRYHEGTARARSTWKGCFPTTGISLKCSTVVSPSRYPHVLPCTSSTGVPGKRGTRISGFARCRAPLLA